ncbi:MAG: cytochrome c biogenesis protein ResB [Aquificae bacterium]|nr:cytochrome c biogenesis protein ResB [Aquificota bacterium]
MLNKIVKILGSPKLGVLALIILAILTVLGSTYIKQGETYFTYVREYGEEAAKIIWILWLDKIFHAWYYQLLMVIVGVSVIFATIDRFPRIFLSAYGKVNKKLSEKLLKKKTTLKFEVNKPIQDVLDRIIQFLADKGFKSIDKIEEKNEIYLFAEKGKISRLGMLVTHIGIIVFLIGAIMGSYFGIRGQVEIAEGESADIFYKFREGSLQAGNEIAKLPFTIKVNRFWLDFYDSEKFKGAIKSFNSEIEIWKEGQLVEKKVIKVNHPMIYEGYRIFQASYGKTGEIKRAKLIIVEYPKMLELMKAVSKVNQQIQEAKTPEEKEKLQKIMRELQTQSVILFSQAPRTDYTFGQKEIKVKDMSLKIVNQTLNYKNPMLVNRDVYDPVIVVKVSYNDKEFNLPILADPNVAIPAFNQFGYKHGFPYLIMIEEFEPRYFSGLQISNFPGTNLIWLGTVIVVLGTMLAFYTIHRRVWIKLEEKDGKTLVYVALYSQKFKESFVRDVKETLPKYLEA